MRTITRCRTRCHLRRRRRAQRHQPRHLLPRPATPRHHRRLPLPSRRTAYHLRTRRPPRQPHPSPRGHRRQSPPTSRRTPHAQTPNRYPAAEPEAGLAGESSNRGSLDSLNVLTRCGWSSKAFQIRPIVVLDNPERLAIEARDQCVALRGVSSRVATTTASTASTLTVAGRPGRGSSTSPSRRSATNRLRHLPTVATAQFSCAATPLLSVPLAQASTILERSANAWEDFARRDHRTSCSRSCSVRVSTVLGRPVLAIPRVYNLSCELTVRHTRQPFAISGRPPRCPSQRRREGRARIGGRPGEPERPTAHQLGEWLVGRAALRRPHGLRPALPECPPQRRSRSQRRSVAALHECREARRAYREQHRRHRLVLPAPGVRPGSSAVVPRRASRT